jgi:hypothetical protein
MRTNVHIDAAVNGGSGTLAVTCTDNKTIYITHHPHRIILSASEAQALARALRVYGELISLEN